MSAWPSTKREICWEIEISFQPKDIDSIAVTNTSARTSDAEVDELSRFNNIDGANTELKETQFNTLIYPLPDRPLALANNITYTYKDVVQKTTDSGGVVTHSLSGTDTYTDTFDTNPQKWARDLRHSKESASASEMSKIAETSLFRDTLPPLLPKPFPWHLASVAVHAIMQPVCLCRLTPFIITFGVDADVIHI